MTSPSSREAAFHALYSVHKEEATLVEVLEAWQKKTKPSSKDFHLSQEIAFGVQRQLLSLDYLAKQLLFPQTLKLKAKEKILFRMALYQSFFLERIPLYAIVDESVRLAKRYCHTRFANFLNAALRKIPEKNLTLPQEDEIDKISARLSYPSFFIEELLKEYPLQEIKEMLFIMNHPPQLMARVRFEKELKMHLFSSAQKEEVANNPALYIQNITPAYLLSSLAKSSFSPKNILDLCAAPGGKILAAHEYFPKAHLFANDSSEKRLLRLKENAQKYHLPVTISCTRAEEFPEEKKFDLIILDVPCSNSGVLHKRPEARWRINPKTLKELEDLQLSLLQKAKKLLLSQGEIWYMTCSILAQENEQLIARACKDLSLHIDQTFKCLPNKEGRDGGFACRLISKESYSG